MEPLLYALLAVDCVQLVAALVAFLRGARSSRAGAPSRARYSRLHGVVLLVGALLLALPVALGLAGVISHLAAVVTALVLEAAAFVLSRQVVKRLEAAHLARRPRAAH
jgi:hypothetical protein